jgi:hypothetical protein
MEITKQEAKLKSGLVRWAAQHDIKPVQFSAQMGYAYATAWDLLRGKRPFTSEALGRFSIAYGTVAAAELLKLADIPDGVDVSPLGGVANGLIVPAVTVQPGVKLKDRRLPASKTKLKPTVVTSNEA